MANAGIFKGSLIDSNTLEAALAVDAAVIETDEASDRRGLTVLGDRDTGDILSVEALEGDPGGGVAKAAQTIEKKLGLLTTCTVWTPMDPVLATPLGVDGVELAPPDGVIEPDIKTFLFLHLN